MSISPTQSYLDGLVAEFRKLPAETPWLEFKQNNSNPDDIGEYISALGNMAALHGKAAGYVVWGVEDGTHKVVGTNFAPATTKKGNEDLESWLVRLLSPRVHFQFHELTHEGHRVVVLEVTRAPGRPIQFQGVEFIRVGSHRQKLKDHPQIEQALWRTFETTPFEDVLVAEHLGAAEVLSLLDYPAFSELLSLPLPSDRDRILESLEAERLIVRDLASGWNITALGAILFAKNLDQFRSLARKAVRVIVYAGPDRIQTVREQQSKKGYAAGFASLIDYVNTLVPRNEVIGPALRSEVPMYPELAIRELIANALIHQDFSVTGTGPMVEIFPTRMEITNPGLPLVKTDRFLDAPPRSRNEALASFMRRVNICEERGSGVDKVVSQTEFYQLPAPLFESPVESTRAVLFAHKEFNDMDRSERSRACYLHACLRYVMRSPMTNTTLRERLGIAEENLSMVSRTIKDAIEDRLVKPFDVQQGRKYAKYLPFWA